jgi:hypothetical protein
MKISYRNYPVLEKVEKKKLGDILHFTCDKDTVNIMKDFIRKEFESITLGINNSHIYHLSDSFLEAYEAAGDRIFESDLYDQIEDQNICLLTNQLTTLLRIRTTPASKIASVAFAMFLNNGTLLSIGEMPLDYSVGIPERNIIGFLSSNEQNAHGHIFNCVLITLFIKYANVETVLLPAGRKVKGIECNYKNETNQRVVLLNSTWFTNLVKSDGFKVRGHFRLQPKKKDGEWTKELIWISDFVKTGYTAPARKLNTAPVMTHPMRGTRPIKSSNLDE